MKKLFLLAAALAAFTGIVSADPAPLSYVDARAAVNNLGKPNNPPATTENKIVAWQAVASASDASPKARADALHELAHNMMAAHSPVDDIQATFYQAAQVPGNTGGFLEYLVNAIRFGDPYKSAAIGQIPAFVAANPSSTDALRAQAIAAAATGQYDQAVRFWTLIANSYRSYEAGRGVAIARVAEASKARGDSPKVTNGLIIPLLTFYNVHVADGSFQAAYKAVNRSVGPNGSFATVGDLAAFLTNINTLVDTTAANKDFLSLVQSQLAAALAQTNQ